MHEEDEAQARQGGDEAGAAVGKEGEGEAGDGHHPQGHPQVHHHLEAQHPREPREEKPVGKPRAGEGQGEEAGEKEAVKPQKPHDAHEPPLLGPHGEDEVRVPEGDEAELGLGALAVALAEKPPEPMAMVDWMTWKPWPKGSR